MKANNQQVLKGALILSFAGLLSKILSALYRVPLQNLTSDFGYYAYQQIYPFIGMLMMLSLYGFPAAISKLTVENEIRQLNRKTFHKAIMFILIGFSLLMSLSLFVLAPGIANLVGDSNLRAGYQVLAFAFILIPLLSFYRGYFQGQGDMRPTAYSQLFEQLVRVIIIIIAAVLIAKQSMDVYEIAVWAAYGTIFGGVCGVFILLLFRKRESLNPQIENNNIKVPWRYFIRTLMIFGVLAALNHMILLLLQFADMFTLVPGLMKYGYMSHDAMEMKGVFDRGQPLVQFGTVLGSSFALAIIPELAKEAKSKQINKDVVLLIKDALTFSLYISVGATVGLVVIFKEVNLLLFGDIAGTHSLQIFMLVICLSSLAITSNAILQSYDYIKHITWLIVAVFIFKIILNLILVPRIGINGSAISSVLSLGLLCILSLLLLKRRITKISLVKMINWRALSYASVSMTLFLIISKYLLINSVIHSRLYLFSYIMVIVSFGGLIYLLCLLRFDALSKRQLHTLPFAHSIIKLERIAKFKGGSS